MTKKAFVSSAGQTRSRKLLSTVKRDFQTMHYIGVFDFFVTTYGLKNVTFLTIYKFSNHVNCVACKVSKYTLIVYKLRRYLDLDSLKLIYHTLIYNNLTFCISACGSSSAPVLIVASRDFLLYIYIINV